MSDDLAIIAHLSQSSHDSSFSRSQLNAYINSNSLSVIKKDDSIVGFIAYRIIVDMAELDQLVIDEKNRGKGVGFQALNLWYSQLRSVGVSTVLLEVRSTNTAATNLYQKCDFVVNGTRKNYYTIEGVKSDALLMSKTL